tara:strand:- start:447 stop:1118 length:672 start_codon:yes stop_codon:yes gene_type:complete
MVSIDIKEWDSELIIKNTTTDRKHLGTLIKYIKLLEGIAALSKKCATDRELLRQWHPVPISEYPKDAFLASTRNKCHCSTKVKTFVWIKNNETKETTYIGRICKEYFNSAAIDGAFIFNSYKRSHGGVDRKKCLECDKNLNFNNESGYCTDCRIQREYERQAQLRIDTANQNAFNRAKVSRMKLGKFKGEELQDTPEWYLPWLIKQTWFRDYGGHVAKFLEFK